MGKHADERVAPEALNPRVLARRAKALHVMSALLSKEIALFHEAMLGWEHDQRNHPNRDRQSGPQGGTAPEAEASPDPEGPDAPTGRW